MCVVNSLESYWLMVIQYIFSAVRDLLSSKGFHGVQKYIRLDFLDKLSVFSYFHSSMKPDFSTNYTDGNII